MRRLALCCTSAVACLTLIGCHSPEPPGGTGAPTASATQVVAKPAPVVPTSDDRYSPSITAEDFAARLKKIASDQFEGRKPGTLGERMTTSWIKDQMQQMGLKPGHGDSWFQSVPMVETTLLDPDQVAFEVTAPTGTERFAYRHDMIVGSLDASPGVDIKGSDLVFVGYGVDAPEEHWNDYADIDVKGKTVIVLANDPGWGNHDETLFKGRALTYYGRRTYKYEEAARRGAAACLIVHEPAAAGYPWQVVVNSWSGPQDTLSINADPAPKLAAAGWISRDAAERLFARAGRNFAELRNGADRRGFAAVELGATLTMQFKNRIAHSSSENVSGYLPGSKRPDETIVYSAHWDHFGRDTKLKGDQTYNGAIDNGTGIAALLEIAEAFAHQDPPPERSIVFLADTLEEAGLLGSRYYVANPPFPLNKTVANINIDALPIIGPTKDIAVLSWGKSQLDDYIKDAAAAQGRSVVPDGAPETGYFFRSDQLSFAKGGVPVLYARSGLDLVDGGAAAGSKAWADYIAHRYHKTSDDYDPNWDFRGVIADVDALYAVGRKLADETTFPQWHADADFRRPSAPRK